MSGSSLLSQWRQAAGILYPKISCKLTVRPDLDFATVAALGKPTAAVLGAFPGFSLPIYAADNEELFLHLKVPERWDGTTNPKLKVCCYLAIAETIGDVFQLQASYNSALCGGGVIPAGVTDVNVQQAVLTDREAQYNSYELEFTIPAAGLTAGDKLGIRIRRIAATGTAIAGEIVVFDTIVEFCRDKLGGVCN